MLDLADCDAYMETWEESVRHERQDRSAPNYKYDLSEEFHECRFVRPSCGKGRLCLDPAVETSGDCDAGI